MSLTEFVVNLTCNPWINIAGSNALKTKNFFNNSNVILVTSRKPSVNPSTSSSVTSVTAIVSTVKSVAIVKVVEVSVTPSTLM